MKIRDQVALASVAIFLAMLSSASAAPIPGEHIRGTILSVTPASIVVTTASGPVTVALPAKTAYIGVVPASVDDIKPGTFVGVTNAMLDGNNDAIEVHIFPNSMRGTAEGDYAWDLPTAGHHSAMTNGTVSAPHASRMTNATVHAVNRDRSIQVAYAGGSKTIAIPPSAHIVRFDSATKKLLSPGTHVFIIAGKNANAYSAKAVVAGENGLVPPM